jgi:outer membrane protein assembly factor BamB
MPAGVLAALLAGLTPPPAQAAAGVDWPTYGFSPTRSGFNPSEHTLGRGNVGSLEELWSTSLGGTTNTQPILAAGLRLPDGRTADVVYAGTEKGRFAAVDAAGGEILWKRELGVARPPDCGNGYGVTDTPVLDRARGSVYIVGGDGVAYELDLATGATKRRWTIVSDTNHEHVWSGLTLALGLLYIPVAGACEIPPFHGRVVAIDVSSGKRVATWYVTGKGGVSGGGIWSWAGVSVDPAAKAVFTATGNSTDHSEHVPYAERVVRLTRTLKVRASHYPGLPHGDADFGATPLLYRVEGCPRQLAVGNKFGQFYVYERRRIGHGPVQRIQLGGSGNGTSALLGNASVWQAERMVYVTNPSERGSYKPGMLAFRVTDKCRLAFAWRGKGSEGIASSPTVANGVVYYGTGFSDKVIAFDARTGKRLWTSGSKLRGHIVNAPSVVGGVVYAGDWSGRLHAFGLRGSTSFASRFAPPTVWRHSL